MTKTFTHRQGILRPGGLRNGMAGLLLASFFMAGSSSAQADVFGGSGGNRQNTMLLERLMTLEKEIKELKDKGQGAPAVPAEAPRSGHKTAGSSKPDLVLPPPPGLDGLPSGGTNERERLLVEKELTHEVLGVVNGLILVRDGDRRLLLTKKELKAFEKTKRQKVVHKLMVDAVSQGDGRLDFPQLQSPQDTANRGGVPGASPTGPSTLTQAGQAVNQARAIEANHGQVPSTPAPPPVANRTMPTARTPARMPASAGVANVAKPAAAPVKK